MGWSIGYDTNWARDIGYGVPAYCDQPGCMAEINRGLAYVCGGEPYGGEYGCGLFFCASHLYLVGKRPQRCLRCTQSKPPRVRISPEHPRWIEWKLNDESWAQWRAENPSEVTRLQAAQDNEDRDDE